MHEVEAVEEGLAFFVVGNCLQTCFKVQASNNVFAQVKEGVNRIIKRQLYDCFSDLRAPQEHLNLSFRRNDGDRQL